MHSIEHGDVLGLLAGLVDKSLVTYEEDAQGQGRYRLLETVRQYGINRLVESGEADGVCERHRDFFLVLAEEAEPELSGPAEIFWLDRLETEHDNLRQALGWCTHENSTLEDASHGLRLAGALGMFWRRRGHRFEGRQWINRMLELAEERFVTKGQAKALLSAGILASDQGDLEIARTDYEKCLALARQKGDPVRIAAALGGLGQIAWFQRNLTTARKLYEESLALYRNLGHRSGIVESLQGLGNVVASEGDFEAAQRLLTEGLTLARKWSNQNFSAFLLKELGNIALDLGHYSEAQRLFTESLSLFQQLNNPSGIGFVKQDLGSVAYYQGEYATARPLLEDSLLLLRQLGLHRFVPHALLFLGQAVSALGEYETARGLLTEGVTLAQQWRSSLKIAMGLAGFGALAQSQGHSVEAARLLGAADAQREAHSHRLDFGDQQEYDQRLASVRRILGEEAFAAAFAEGQAMPTDEAIEYALASTDG